MGGMKIVSAIACCLAAALAAPVASAQEFYKSTMPDGRVVYGDKPAPGAAKVEKTKPVTSKIGIEAPSSRETETVKDLEASRRGRERAQNRVQEAEQALRQAEAARDAGKDSLEGERQGTAKKGVQRLTDEYWERQKKLEADVEAARRNLEAARSGK
jgi:hypothetical protein